MGIHAGYAGETAATIELLEPLFYRSYGPVGELLEATLGERAKAFLARVRQSLSHDLTNENNWIPDRIYAFCSWLVQEGNRTCRLMIRDNLEENCSGAFLRQAGRWKSRMRETIPGHPDDSHDENTTRFFIGIFSSVERAQAIVAQLSQKPGFRDDVNGFRFDSAVIDQAGWV